MGIRKTGVSWQAVGRLGPGYPVAASHRVASLRGGELYGPLPFGWCFPPFVQVRTMASLGRLACIKAFFQALHLGAAALDLPWSLKRRGRTSRWAVQPLQTCGWCRRRLDTGHDGHVELACCRAVFSPSQLAATNGEGPFSKGLRSLVGYHTTTTAGVRPLNYGRPRARAAPWRPWDNFGARVHLSRLPSRVC